MAKSESLMGEVATDWMDTECPEAKRLKVVPLSLIPALRVLGGGPDGQGESQGESLLSPAPGSSHGTCPILPLSNQASAPRPRWDLPGGEPLAQRETLLSLCWVQLCPACAGRKCS